MNQQDNQVPEHNILDLRKKVSVEKPDKSPSVDFFTVDETFEEPKKKKTKKIKHAYRKNTRQFTTRRFRFSFNFSPTFTFRLKALKGVIIGSAIIITSLLFINIYQDARETKASLLESSAVGLELLKTAESALTQNERTIARDSLVDAQEHFLLAQRTFSRAQKTYGPLLLLPGISDDVQNADALLKLGSEVSALGLQIDEMATRIEQEEEPGFVSFFSAYETHGSHVRESLDTIHVLLGTIHIDSLDEAYKEDVISTKNRFDALYGTLKRVDSLSAILSEILGFSGEKTYLFVFQNNQELRPTGGFIGSIAQVSLFNGHIQQLSIPEGGSYDISGQIDAQFQAPKPLQIVNPYFTFQDANWFPDFPTSAKKILSLYDEAGLKKVDGIVAFTPEVLLDFLKLTGPVTIDEYDQEINADNFLRFTRDEIEKKKEEGSVKPKKVIADMMPLLIDKLFSLSSLQQIDVALTLNSALQTKDMLVYSEDPTLQEKIAIAGFAGEQTPQVSGDYLSLIDTNIAGGKTSRDIEQHVFISSHINEAYVENTVIITRKHNGTPFDPYTGVANLSYLRLYIPLGAEFVDATNFYPIPASWYQLPPNNTPIDNDLESIEKSSIVNELTGTRIAEEAGFTVLGNWMKIQPGQSQVSTITYKVDRSISPEDEWSLYIRKQPGTTSSVTWEVTSEKSIERIIASTKAQETISGGSASLSFDLLVDTALGVVLKD